MASRISEPAQQVFDFAKQSIFREKIKKQEISKYYELNQKNEIICTGNTVLAFLSSMKKRPVRCPKFLLEKFS